MHIDLTGNPTIFWILFIVVAVGVIFFKYKQSKFKTTGLKPIMQRIFPGCVYEPNKTITKEEFKDIGCLKAGSRFYGEDLLYAKTDTGLAFRYCEINTYTNYSSGDVQHRDMLFEGAIVSFDSKKPIESCFYIVSKTSKAKKYFHKKFMSGIEKTGTENALFDQHFKLYTNDLTGAYTILKPQNLEKLIAIKTKYKNLIIAFNDNQVHIILPGINLFKVPGVNFSAKNQALMCKKCCNDLTYLVNVINDFNYFK